MIRVKVGRILWSIAAILVCISNGEVKAQLLNIEPESGFYSDSVVVDIQNYSSASTVYYTLDGSLPDSTSPIWNDSSLVLKETSVLKTTIFTDADTHHVVKSYFINEPTELPVLSLTTDPDNFFSDEKGIYVEGTNGITGYCEDTPMNWNQDWERPVKIEFFEKDRSKGFTVDAGVKIGGGCTRLYDQKSLDIYFRGEYGAKKLEYQVFEDKPITSFDRLALRSGGQDWYRAMIRNAAAQSIVRDRMDLGYQAFKPVVVFLNGEYWGIHMLREKQNEDFIESNYGFDENELDILTRNARVKEGSSDHYDSMIDFIEQNDLSVSENYEWVSEQMEIDQYIDYLIAQIYWANGDWPGGNIIFWRPQLPDGKWRWLLYDVDMSMGSHSRGVFDTNMIQKLTDTSVEGYESPEWSTFLFRNLLKNQDFRNKFVQKFSMHVHTTFEPSRMINFVDSTAQLIESEVPRHMERWTKSFRLGSNMNWEKHIEVMKTFIRSRKNYTKNNVLDYFDLLRLNSLETKVQPAGAGKVYIEEIRSDNLEYGLIYNSVPASIKAEANPGYTFVGWEGAANGTEISKEIMISQNTALTAVFKRNQINTEGIVINEINYRSADNFNPEDWIEFYNNSSESVDISGWYFSDSDDSHKFIFPEGTILNANSYLVLTRDSTLFKDLFPEVANRIGDMDFGLSGDGELVRLFNSDDEIVDELTYNDKAPWPLEADGLGSTLSLSNPGFDNSNGANWAASSGNGTPGAQNTDVIVSNEDIKSNEIPYKISLNQNYPNPFNPTTSISYSIQRNALVSLKVYDVTGRIVATLVEDVKPAGNYIVNFDAGNLASGVYFYRLTSLGEIITKKLTLLK